MDRDTSFIYLLEKEYGYLEFQEKLNFPLRIWKVDCQRDVESAKEFMASVFPGSLSFVKGPNTLILFLTEEKETEVEVVDICWDLRAQSYQDVSVFVSYSIKRIEDAYGAFHILLDLTSLSTVMPTSSKVYECDKMSLPLHLNRTMEKELEPVHTFLDSKIDTLEAIDQDLLATAIEFLNTNLNVTDTANRLYIHRNTLLYRLGRIKSLTGYDIRNYMEATNFYFTYLLKILRKS